MTYLNLFSLINIIILTKVCVCIRDFRVLKRSIVLSFILKSKILVKFLSSLDKKDAITTPKTKNNNDVLLIKPKKIPLLNNLF